MHQIHTSAHFQDYILHPLAANSGSCVACCDFTSLSLICLTFISLLGIPLLFCFGEFNIRGILRVILRLIHILKLDSLGELLLFYTVYHSVLLLYDICKKKWGEHLTPLWRGDLHICSRKELSTITIRPLDIYTSSNFPSITEHKLI